MDRLLARLVAANDQNDQTLRLWFKELYDSGGAAEFYEVMIDAPPVMWPPVMKRLVVSLASSKFNELLEQLHDPNRIDSEAQG